MALTVHTKGFMDVPNSILEKKTLFHIAVYIATSAVVLLAIYSAERYLRFSNESSVSWVLLGLTLALGRIESFQEAPGRIIFILISGLITLRYFTWRTFDTLIYTNLSDAAGMMLLYLAEWYSITIHFMGMFINIWPLEHKPAPLPDDRSLLPTVDILIPTYNESDDIVRLTATAASQIDYPREKVNIYILDDGGTLQKRGNPETSQAAWDRHHRLRDMAAALGAHYLTRETNEHAKAGNINHALKKTGGDLILILDCDHVPTKDFLKNTVGWFLKDKKLFLVQTPHFFINPTTVEKNIGSFSNSPGENDMFYRQVHLGMDFWNSSYFCGSAAVLRRKYLMELGGISGNTITEDAETSLHLHNKGYSSVFIKRTMICGLSPETFDAYILQRTRWAQGMAQIFMLTNPILAKGLTIPQKLCYFNSCFFWFFGLARFIFYLGPALFLILGLKVYYVSVNQILVYALPHVISTFIVMDYFYGRVRRPFFSEIYESVQSIFLMPAILSVILNPKKPQFKITPKGKKIESEFTNPMAAAFLLVGLVNLVAVPLAIYKWFYYPLFRDVILITFCWCVYNLVLTLVTLGAFIERKQLRQHHRIRVKGQVRIFSPDTNQYIEGEIRDMSLTGIGIELNQPDFQSANDDIKIESYDSYGEKHELRAKVITHIKKGEKVILGLEFVINKETYPSVVRFVYGDSQRWEDLIKERSQQANSTKSDMRYFAIRGIKGALEIFAYLNKMIYATLKKQAYAASSKIHAASLKIIKEAR